MGNTDNIIERIEELIQLKLEEKEVADHNGLALSVEITRKKKELARLLYETIEYGD